MDMIEVYKKGPIYKVREVDKASMTEEVVRTKKKNGMGDTILKILYDCVDSVNRQNPQKREQRLDQELSLMFG